MENKQSQKNELLIAIKTLIIEYSLIVRNPSYATKTTIGKTSTCILCQHAEVILKEGRPGRYMCQVCPNYAFTNNSINGWPCINRSEGYTKTQALLDSRHIQKHATFWKNIDKYLSKVPAKHLNPCTPGVLQRIREIADISYNIEGYEQ